MLALENIDVTLGKGTNLERVILKNLGLSVSSGDFITIIGRNGAGKSTLFRVISGDLNPDKGKVIIDKKDVTSLSRVKRSAFIAKVFQDPKQGTIDNMTIFENMAFALKRGLTRPLLPFNRKHRKEIFQEKLSLLKMGLEKRLNDLVSNLSGGQRQGLSLIMAILQGSSLLLLDEITAALDPKTADNVMKLTNDIVHTENRTTIMITHNMQHALTYGNRTLLLRNGHFMNEVSASEKKLLTAEALATRLDER